MRRALPLAVLVLALAGCAAPAGVLPAGIDPAEGILPPLAIGEAVVLPVPERDHAFEPSVSMDDAGHVLVTASHPFSPMWVWASADGGRSFRAVRGEMEAEPGDAPLGIEGHQAFAPDGAAYFLHDWLGSLAVHRSLDGGATWELRNPAAMAIPGGDRPWMAAGSDGRVALSWNQLPAGFVLATSRDGGRTFPVQTPFAGTAFVQDWQLPPVPLYLRDGTLLVPRTEPEGPVVYLSTDDGATFARHVAWRGSNARSDVYPVVAEDLAGALYLVTQEIVGGTMRTLYGVSLDGGATWSAPREVTSAPGVQMYSWAAAGPAGRLLVAFYENPNGSGEPDEEIGDWFLRVVVLDGADGAEPLVREARVLETPVLHGRICSWSTPDCGRVCQPFACVGLPGQGEGPSLGDYLGVAMARDGSAVVAFQIPAKGRLVYAATVDTGAPTAGR